VKHSPPSRLPPSARSADDPTGARGLYPVSTAGVGFVAGGVVSFVIALIWPPMRRFVKHDASPS